MKNYFILFIPLYLTLSRPNPLFCPAPLAFQSRPPGPRCPLPSPPVCPTHLPPLPLRCFPQDAPQPDITRIRCSPRRSSQIACDFFDRFDSCPLQSTAKNATSPSSASPIVGRAKIMLIGGEDAAGTGQAKTRRWFTRGTSYEGFMWKLLVDYASVASGGKLVGSTAGISNAGDVLHGDESRYAISACDLPNKKFIIKLSETIYLDKLGLVSAEFYAATYRHIQVLGSSKWPTNEWRILGEIETNPLATAEVFDLSESGKCAKCFVRFIKLRVLSHHTIEGFSRCALTRVQVFGSTLLESIDRLSQGVDSPGAGTASTAVAVSMMSAVDVVDRRLSGDFSDPPSVSASSGGSGPAKPESPLLDGHAGSSADSPLLKFIEDMTELQRNYAKVSASVSTLVAALQNAQTEISTLKLAAHNVSSNISISDIGLVKPGDGNVAISEFFQTWQPVLVTLLAVSQLVLFIKFSGDAGNVGAGSPSRSAALRRSDSSPRLKARLSIFAKRKSIARTVTGIPPADRHRGLFKGTAAFKAARHVAKGARAVSLD